MQDKYTKERHETLVDQGWRSMAAILDAEMPLSPVGEQKKRRSAIWIWLFLASGLFAGLALMQLAQTRPVEQKKPAAAQPVPAIAQAQLDEPAASAENMDIEEAQSNVSSGAGYKNQSVVVASQPSRPVPAFYSAEKNGLYPEEIAVWSAIEDASVPIFDQELPPEMKPLQGQYAVQPLLPALPGMQLVSLDAPKSNPEWAAPPVRRASKKLRFGVEAAAGSGAANGGNSVAIGPVAALKVSPRLTLQSGLLVESARYNLSPDGGGRARVDLNAPSWAVNTPLDLVAERVYNGQNWTLTTLSLQIPAVLSYRISPRFQVETGVTTGYNVKSENLASNISAESLNSGSSTSTTNNFTLAQIDRAVSTSVSRWEFVLSAGVRYFISPEYSVGLHYEHGLNDLLADQSLQARQRNLRFSGMMYF